MRLFCAVHVVWSAWLDSIKAFALRFVRDFSEQLAARGRQGNPSPFGMAQFHNAEIGLSRYDRVPFKDVQSERQRGPVHPTREKPGLRVSLNVGERQRIEALVARLADESAAHGTAALFAVTQLRALCGSLRAAKQCLAIDAGCFLSRPWQKPAVCRRTWAGQSMFIVNSATSSFSTAGLTFAL
jgi:hypothetical protein